MRIFYSGATSVNASQYTPAKSLGGYISSTLIPNGKVDSLFSSFSNLSINNKKVETKGFFVKNVFDYTIKNLVVFCLYPEPKTVDVKIAASEGDQLELLRSPYDTPYFVEFYDLSVKYSYTDIKIIGSFKTGEEVEIEGRKVLVSDGTVETFLSNAVKVFSKDPLYSVSILDSATLRLQYRILGVYTNTPVITSFYPNVFSFNAFDNGLDNSVLIANELAPGESIGIWLQRTPDESLVKPHSDQYYKDLFLKFQENEFLPVQNEELGVISFCMEWS